MVGSVFISYRREESAADARSIYQRLQRAFGGKRLFMDVESIRRGRDFQKVLDEYLGKSQVMLAVIGPRWCDVRDAEGQRRLFDPDDFVRLELSEALRRNIAIIPVLIGGARIPRAAELPDDLRALTRRQGITVTHENFARDMDALERDIRALLKEPGPWRWIAAAATAGLVGIGVVAADRLRELVPWFSSVVSAVTATAPSSHKSLQDCAECPVMVVVPAADFMMGANDGESNERPVHRVTILAPFAVGKYEVTFSEWEACVAGGGCQSNKSPSDAQWGKGGRPVIGVSWHDANEYAAWLSHKTGKTYRLLTEAEWEYVARAGSTTRYHFGNDENALCNYGNVADLAMKPSGRTIANCSDGYGPSAPVGTFKPNAFGIHDVHGNVKEWVQDCYQNNYEIAPVDGSANRTITCLLRVARGGSFFDGPQKVRAAFRYLGLPPESRVLDIGFRVARSITP